MTQDRARDAKRDLVPAVFAAGAVGLVVTLVVGGTTAGIDRSLPEAPAGVAELAGSPDDGAGISVRVRPSLPPPIPVTTAVAPLDSLFAAPPVVVRRSSPARVPTVALASVATAPATLTTASAAPVAGAAPVAPVAAAPLAPLDESTVVTAASAAEGRSPGRSAAAPGHSATGRGRSAEAAGHPATGRGPAAAAPGHSATAAAHNDRVAPLLVSPDRSAKQDAKAERKAAKAAAKADRKSKR